MQFRDFFLSMPVEARKDFAKAVSAPLRTLYNIAYLGRKANAAIAVQIEKETRGIIRADDLRPDIEWSAIRKSRW